jgi:hypothetical protein
MAEKFIGFVSRGAGLQIFYEGLVKIGFASSQVFDPGVVQTCPPARGVLWLRFARRGLLGPL